MIDLTQDTRPEKSGLPPRKTASGSSGVNPNKHAYRIDPEALKPRRVERPTSTTTASGVSVYGFRYYVSEIGRWLSRDPIEERGGYNLYGFADNCGVSKIDRLGLVNKRDTLPAFHLARLGNWDVRDWDGTYNAFYDSSKPYEEEQLCACIDYRITQSSADLHDNNFGTVSAGHRTINNGDTISLGVGHEDAFLFGVNKKQLDISASGVWKSNELPVEGRETGLCCKKLRAAHRAQNSFVVQLVLRTTDPKTAEEWMIRKYIPDTGLTKHYGTVGSRLAIGFAGDPGDRLNRFAGSDFSAEVWIGEEYGKTQTRCKPAIKFQTNSKAIKVSKDSHPAL